MTTEHKPHIELLLQHKGFTPQEAEALENLIEQLETQRKVINEARGYCWELNTEGMADTDTLEQALHELNPELWPSIPASRPS